MRTLHTWDVTPRQAIQLQKQLCLSVILRNQFDCVSTIAGVDVGFEDNGKITRAAVAVLDFPSLQLQETAIARIPTCFPYIPGLLSFREMPAVLAAVKKLSCDPDLYVCDGQGYAHPRRFGIACHLGVWLDKPAIGVGKSRLIGTSRPVAGEKGSWQMLVQDNEIIGAVLRTRSNIRPVYISVGHRLCLDTAIQYVFGCITRYRLPETTRFAHRFASGL